MNCNASIVEKAKEEDGKNGRTHPNVKFKLYDQKLFRFAAIIVI